ncbi:RNA polymerase sigma factor [Occultella glacieicola]|uniref:RNA polymerase sigma factor n=1 Tax=Occultella glacieicola TaxID=2518684 RepID=A0ABY2ECZ8_9MICO|nr:RNA polymerase sigma factor [Occultella glacieicola]TDE98662.1 RNA polymerase sigma factor [Occultella glacieicola]
MSDEDRFDRLYQAHRPDLERFVRRRVSPAQVEDVVAETFLVAWRRLDDLPTDPRPWLFGIARNLMLRSVRSTGRWHALQVRLAAEPRPATEDLATEVATRTDLARAWAKLSVGEQEVLALIGWDGLSAGEAATVLGCHVGTFRMRLLRARRHLLHILDRLPPVEARPTRPVTNGALS